MCLAIGDEFVPKQAFFNDRPKLDRSTMRMLRSGGVQIAANKRQQSLGFREPRNGALI